MMQARANDYIKALGGEALCVLMEEVADPPENILRTYEGLLLDGVLLAPSAVILKLAERLNSKNLQLLGQRLWLQDELRSRSTHRQPSRRDLTQALTGPVIEVRRFVQSTCFAFTAKTVAETAGRRGSIFRSAQERTFLKALWLRFPALLALPNYPLDGVAELSCLREALGERAWSYAKHCRIDALLVLPDEGRPVAAFELDSQYHDQPDVQLRDEMKNAIFRLLAVPFFRLRVESPNSVTCDEWYRILSDEVVPRLDLGQRLPPCTPL